MRYHLTHTLTDRRCPFCLGTILSKPAVRDAREAFFTCTNTWTDGNAADCRGTWTGYSARILDALLDRADEPNLIFATPSRKETTP